MTEIIVPLGYVETLSIIQRVFTAQDEGLIGPVYLDGEIISPKLLQEYFAEVADLPPASDAMTWEERRESIKNILRVTETKTRVFTFDDDATAVYLKLILP